MNDLQYADQREYRNKHSLMHSEKNSSDSDS